MLVSSGKLATVTTGLKLSFQQGFDDIQKNPSAEDWKKIAMEVPSGTAEEEYGWLQSNGRMREWLGDRQINNLIESGYKIKNRDFEQTIGIKVNDINDNKLYGSGIESRQLGADAREFPNELIFELLKKGTSTKCFDGQYFFDTDHPVLGADGIPISVSNVDSSGAPGDPYWYLMDTRKAMQPLIYQMREAFKFVQITAADSDHVFKKKEYLFGVDGRCNAGYGLWQLAYASNAPLTAENYKKARRAMGELKSDKGKPLGIKPNLLVVGPAFEEEALKVVSAATLANGATNVWAQSVSVLNTPWLG